MKLCVGSLVFLLLVHHMIATSIFETDPVIPNFAYIGYELDENFAAKINQLLEDAKSLIVDQLDPLSIPTQSFKWNKVVLNQTVPVIANYRETNVTGVKNYIFSPWGYLLKTKKNNTVIEVGLNTNKASIRLKSKGIISSMGIGNLFAADAVENKFPHQAIHIHCDMKTNVIDGVKFYRIEKYYFNLKLHSKNSQDLATLRKESIKKINQVVQDEILEAIKNIVSKMDLTSFKPIFQKFLKIAVEITWKDEYEKKP